MSEREGEKFFCSECQNEVSVEKARVLNGRILCPEDLAKRSFLERFRARKLPQNYNRRSGKTFHSLFTSIAALLLVVGIVVVFKRDNLLPGVSMIFAAVIIALFGMLAGDLVDLLLDILDQLRHNRH